jgi:hypothetical protein
MMDDSKADYWVASRVEWRAVMSADATADKKAPMWAEKKVVSMVVSKVDLSVAGMVSLQL